MTYRPANDSGFGIRDDLYGGWGNAAPAQGEIRIPAGQHVRLEVSKAASTDLEFLSSFEPDSLKSLRLRGTDVTDKQLKHIAHLTGLEFVNLQSTRIGDGGVRHLKNLHRLRTLDLSAFSVEREGFGVGNAAMIIAARLPAPESLRLTKVTDGG